MDENMDWAPDENIVEKWINLFPKRLKKNI